MLRKFLLPIFIILVCSFFSGCSDVSSLGQAEYHHVFPREFTKVFKQAGINVDDYTIKLTMKDHRGFGKGLQYVPNNWNEEWRNWLLSKDTSGFTKQEALTKAEQMLAAAGCKGEFQFYNYNTKALSAGSIFASNSNFILKQCERIGYFLLRYCGWCGGLIAFFAAIGTTFLGFFGIKAGHPVAVGVGFLVFVFGIMAIIGIVFLVKWIMYTFIIPFVLGLGALGAQGYI